MKKHLNTLFVTTDGAYLAKDGQAVAVRHEKETRLRVPLHNLDGVVCFGRVGLSPALMGACAEAGVSISLLSEYGRFRAAVVGFSPGNVLLRREQYRVADDEARSCQVARSVVAGKIANSRSVLMRAVRDGTSGLEACPFAGTIEKMAGHLELVRYCESLAEVRGVEGESARAYFGVFDHLIGGGKPEFSFAGRVRRPPTDPVNALLSFLYTILTHDARSACESVGLDAAVGFLHRDRPGRPSLALDLIEEFRSFLVDRLVLSLVNRRQVSAGGFKKTASGAVEMDDKTRKAVLTAYQKRKQETITHPFLNEKTTVGLLVHLQARLLARHLRGDLDAYPAFIWR
ncbi:MAG: type I-C CRISPR-associated endonuclease Cas1 [Planctomycetaceae bacterium]|nr:type I-C CRISPR-associated endonuclease Cas1 [Planctomycetaceae bacterium]